MIFSKHLIKEDFKESSLFPLLVDGESMQPVINHKAVIVSDLSKKELLDSSIYVLYYENKMWVKRYDLKSKTFISINPNFSHLVYKEEDVYIISKVLITFTTF